MPAPATADDLLALILKSGVLSRHAVAPYLRGPAAPSPQELVQALVRDALLTSFQAGVLLQGKWRNLVLSGKYRVLEPIGAGGMARVYLCEHTVMGRRVAVKVLPSGFKDGSVEMERFYREARAVAALDHPNIVHAYDVGRDGDLHFFVMEYVDGESLQRLVDANGPLPVGHAVHYVRQAALGLQHAHEAGLVHRDIKPGNLLVDRQGVVKILDLGLARFFHDDDELTRRSEPGVVMGTADYISPEQIADFSATDIRADLYSLGCTFYFLLTRAPPFAGATIPQKMLFHQTRDPAPIRSVRPDVSPELAAVLAKLMAKDPARRYQTPAEAAAALIFGATGPLSAPSLASVTLASSEAPTALLDPGQKAAPPDDLPPTVELPRRRESGRWLQRAGWLAFLAVVVASGLYVRSVVVHPEGKRRGPPVPPVPTSSTEPEPVVTITPFAEGFRSPAGLALNGFGPNPAVIGTALRLTDGNMTEARSAWWAEKVPIRTFTTTFTFQIDRNNHAADGFAFVVQDGRDGTAALGDAGEGLGCVGIDRSVAVFFRLHPNANLVGQYVDGTETDSVPLGGGIDLHSGAVYAVTLVYDGKQMAVAVADEADPAKQFRTRFAAARLVDVVASATAYVGFTGGTGGLTAVQDLRKWKYTTPLPAPRP